MEQSLEAAEEPSFLRKSEVQTEKENRFEVLKAGVVILGHARSWILEENDDEEGFNRFEEVFLALLSDLFTIRLPAARPSDVEATEEDKGLDEVPRETYRKIARSELIGALKAAELFLDQEG